MNKKDSQPRKQDAMEKGTTQGWADVIHQMGDIRREHKRKYPQHAKLEHPEGAGQWDGAKAFLMWARENPIIASPVVHGGFTDEEVTKTLAAYLEIDLEAYEAEEVAMGVEEKLPRPE